MMIARKDNYASLFLFRLVVWGCCLSSCSEAWTAQKPDAPATEEELVQQQRSKFAEELARSIKEGRFDDALAVTEKRVEWERQVGGPESCHVATALGEMAVIYEYQGKLDEAKPIRQKIVDIERTRHAANHGHWHHINARLNLDFLERVEALPQESRGAVTQYRSLLGIEYDLYQDRDYQSAARVKAKSQVLRETVQRIGFQDERIASQEIVNQGWAIYLTGDYRGAQRLWTQALAIQQRILTLNHPQTAEAINNLGVIAYFLGDYTQASQQLHQFLNINLTLYGEDHLETATALNNLAIISQDLGDFAAAEAQYRRAAKIFRKLFGEEHQDYATVIDNQAAMLRQMGDLDGALALHKKALGIRARTVTKKHRNYARSLYHVAGVLVDRGDYVAAEPLLQEAMAIWKEVLGENHDDYASSLGRLAGLYVIQGKYERAEPLLTQAAEIYRNSRGESLPFAETLSDLARVYRLRGKYDESERAIRSALQLKLAAVGEEHASYAKSLLELGLFHLAKNELGESAQALSRAVEICRKNLELTSAVQSERQQLASAAFLRAALDRFLVLSTREPSMANDAYATLLAWKGAVFARQRRLRLQRGDSRFASTFRELEDVTSRLAKLSLTTPPADEQAQRHQQIAELTEHKERLERELAGSGKYQRDVARTRRQPAEIQKVLPADFALIDFVEYSIPAITAGQLEQPNHLMAFIVRPSEPVIQIDLGPLQPISQAIDDWLAYHVQMDVNLTGDSDGPQVSRISEDPGPAVRRVLWQPLEKYLTDARTLLISPDGPVGRFPFAALPGKQPNSYLIEEVAVAVIPVPAMLPDLEPDSSRDMSPPSLLCIGDVDFDAGGRVLATPGSSEQLAQYRGPGSAANRAGSLMQWDRLIGTLAESVTVERNWSRRFPDARLSNLQGEAASETAFRELAPQYRYIHIATHGFFAPTEVKSALSAVSVGLGRDLAGWHPGLLSGLVFAGANNQPEFNRDDGVLTALEIAALDLQATELMVLSACETGLGPSAGGEGILGLQRSCQLAGADTVVATLWRLKDDPNLMIRFYENLWQKGMPKLQALREAQLATLYATDRRGPGGAQRERNNGQPYRAAPRLWAAWVLSGDWR